MKYVKILGLLAVAAAAMMAFAASASATTVTGPTVTTEVHTTQTQIETPTIHAVSEDSPLTTGTHVLLHNDIADIECESTAEGTVTKHGPTETASGPLDVLSFTGCTGGWVVDVEKKGTLEIHYKEPTDGNPHGWGTLTSNEATVRATRFGVSCLYRTENTHIGTVTGGDPATLHIEALIPFHGGSFLCGGQDSNWTGSYVTTHTLKIDP